MTSDYLFTKRYVDGRRESIGMFGVLEISITTPENKEFRVKVINTLDGDGIQISVDHQMVVEPKASNVVLLTARDYLEE